MKEIQVIVTITITDEELSDLLDPHGSLSAEALIYSAMENGDETYCFDPFTLSGPHR